MQPGISFGRLVKERRKNLDLTQDELAKSVGCAVVTIKKIEADALRPSKQIAQLLAEALEIAPNDQLAFLRLARAALDAEPLPIQRAPAQLAALPTGTLTFLFTDIQDSTRLWSQHPDRMGVALAHHDTLLHEAISRHGGIVFKTVGDGFHAAFGIATDALAAALDAQRALLSQRWGEMLASRDSEPILTVRMALHSGSAKVRDGDYFGHTLNRVARLLGAGHGGQILLSAATLELVLDQLPPDVSLRDLGAHWLKGLQRPEQIAQIVAPDLPTDFAPLVTLDRPTTNLPLQFSAFIGREQEIQAVGDLLRRTDIRLVTLTGPGGTGKTRLALEVASLFAEEVPARGPQVGESAFPQGVWFVNLAPVSEPSLLVAATAASLGVREAAGQSLLESLKHYLQAKRILLLIDNFEHIVGAAPIVAELLAAAPGLMVLATSRMPLRLSGEREYSVPPLALPDLQHLPRELERLTQYEAVRLFIERSQAVKVDFAITNQNAPAVAEICHRLDGLPLAIELAAARSKLFPPQALLAQLSHRLTFLTGGPRDLPSRQQTIRNTIDWSYELLDEGEKTLFARLGVFVGGCTLEAAEAICNPSGDLPIEIVDGMAALLDKSLVRREADLDDELHFTILETLREYMLERLDRRGEAETIRRAHLDYYLRLAERTAPMLRQAEQLTWVARLSADYANLRAALLWGAAGTRQDDAARLATALLHYWRLRGNVREGRQLLADLLTGQNRLAVPMQAQSLLAAGYLANWHLDAQSAITLASNSLSLYQELGDQQGILRSTLLLGSSLEDHGQFGRARQLFEACLQLCREIDDQEVLVEVLLELGRLAVSTDASARTLIEEAIALARKRGDRLLIVACLRAEADLAIHLGDYERARGHLEESLFLAREIGGNVEISAIFNHLGEVARLQNDYERAETLYQEYSRLCREAGIKQGPVYSGNMGYVMLHRHQYEPARALFTEGLFLCQERGFLRGIANCLVGFAGVFSKHQPKRAAQLLGASEALNNANDSTLDRADRAEYDRIMSDVRAVLDEAAFLVAWTEGQAMNQEEAIATALLEGRPSVAPERQ